MSQPAGKSGVVIKIGVLILSAAAYLFMPGVRELALTGLKSLKQCDFQAFRAFILGYGALAPLTSIALMALQSLVPFVPGLVITVANAWIFGWHYGAVYSWIGALLGALLDFYIARWYGRPLVERIVKKAYLRLVDNYLQRHGVLAVLISRVIPVVPFKIISFGAGLTIIPVRQYCAATAIGQTPGIVLYSVLGQDLIHNVYTLIIATCLLSGAAGLVYYCRARIEKCFIQDEQS